MKLNKFAAAGATFALAVGSVVGIGAAANAIEVPIDEIGVEGDSYPEEQWFVGDPAGPALSQDETGLTIPGRNQVLYGWSFSGEDGEGVTTEEFTALIEGASFEATGDDVTFQVPVFFGPADATGADLLFTTLRPAVPGSPSTETEWISSRAFTLGGTSVAANTPVDFATIAAAFDAVGLAGGNPEILAFGVFVGEGDTAVLESVTWDGETWTFATPAVVTPPPAVVPTPIQDPATFTG